MVLQKRASNKIDNFEKTLQG